MLRTLILTLALVLGLSGTAQAGPPEGEAATAHLKQALGISYQPDRGAYPNWICSIPNLPLKVDYVPVCRADDPKGAAMIGFVLVDEKMDLEEALRQRYKRAHAKNPHKAVLIGSGTYEVNGKKYEVRDYRVDVMDANGNVLYRPYFSAAQVLVKNGARLILNVANGDQKIHNRVGGIEVASALKEILTKLTDG